MSGLDADACDEAFAKYFGSTSGSAFKETKNLTFVKSVGGFVDLSQATVDLEVPYGGGSIKLSAEDLKTIQNSNVADIEADYLLEKVNEAASLISTMGDDDANMATLMSIINSDGFTGYFGTLLGADPNAAHRLVCEKLGISVDTPRDEIADSDYNGALNALMGNGLVLYTADVTANMDDEDISDFMDILHAGGAKSVLKTALNSTDGATKAEALAQTTMIYGLCTTYAQAQGNPDLAKDPITALGLLEDSKFIEYVDSKEGQQDLAAYRASLGTISNSAEDVNAVSTLLVKGFDDPDLVTVLKAALGQ